MPKFRAGRAKTEFTGSAEKHYTLQGNTEGVMVAIVEDGSSAVDRGKSIRELIGIRCHNG